jgi:hypothetical protein
MNYYEELGLPREASVQQIRQAYRILARLVHPDVQADPQVRFMAERQMKRLNAILATLSDSRSRREYDESLMSLTALVPAGSATGGPMAAGQAPKVSAMRRNKAVPTCMCPAPEPWRERLPEWASEVLAYWFWIALAVGILGVIYWYVAAGNSPPAVVAVPKPAAVYQPDPSAPRLVRGGSSLGCSCSLAKGLLSRQRMASKRHPKSRRQPS